MDEHVVEKLIAELDFIRVRLFGQAHLWMGDCTEYSCQVFLAGFETACHAAGVRVRSPHRELAAAKRGWSGPIVEQAGQMRERGFSEEQVVSELLAIEMDALKLAV